MAKLNFKKITDRVVAKAPGLIVGSMAANIVATQSGRLLGGKGGAMAVPAIQIAVGALLPGLVGGGKKGQFIESVGDGIMAQGAVQLAKALNLPGIGDAGVGDIYEDTLAGDFEEEPVLTGAPA
jgi:hypothetical protein